MIDTFSFKSQESAKYDVDLYSMEFQYISENVLFLVVSVAQNVIVYDVW